MFAGKGNKAAWGWTFTCPRNVSRDGWGGGEELDPSISQHSTVAGACSRYVFGIRKFRYPQETHPG